MVEVPAFFEVQGQRPGQHERGVFQRGFRRGLGDHRGVIGLQPGQVRGEVRRRLPLPCGVVVGAPGDGEAHAQRVETVLNTPIQLLLG